MQTLDTDCHLYLYFETKESGSLGGARWGAPWIGHCLGWLAGWTCGRTLEN